MIKSRLNELATYEWCSQLVENSHHRGSRGDWPSLRALAYRGECVSNIVFHAFEWSCTPQDHGYWEEIREDIL